jgi:septal ring factor EnvC (AmiA/AmiB activator)
VAEEPKACRIEDGFYSEHKSGQVDEPMDYCEEAAIRGWVRRASDQKVKELTEALAEAKKECSHYCDAVEMESLKASWAALKQSLAATEKRLAESEARSEQWRKNFREEEEKLRASEVWAAKARGALRGCLSVLIVAKNNGPWPDCAAGLREEVEEALSASPAQPQEPTPK